MQKRDTVGIVAILVAVLALVALFGSMDARTDPDRGPWRDLSALSPPATSGVER